MAQSWPTSRPSPEIQSFLILTTLCCNSKTNESERKSAIIEMKETLNENYHWLSSGSCCCVLFRLVVSRPISGLNIPPLPHPTLWPCTPRARLFWGRVHGRNSPTGEGSDSFLSSVTVPRLGRVFIMGRRSHSYPLPFPCRRCMLPFEIYSHKFHVGSPYVPFSWESQPYQNFQSFK